MLRYRQSIGVIEAQMDHGIWLVMFRERAVTLAAVAEFLHCAADWHVGSDQDQPVRLPTLVIKRGGASVAVGFQHGPVVLAESHEIATRFGSKHPHRAEIAACDRRFEIAYELRPDMKNFNLLCAVEHQLRAFLGGMAFTFMPEVGEIV